jgi:hypothetical protein
MQYHIFFNSRPQICSDYDVRTLSEIRLLEGSICVLPYDVIPSYGNKYRLVDREV